MAPRIMSRADVKGLIYLLTFPNGKKYVGITTQLLAQRISKHRNDAMVRESTKPLHRAWRKYGEPQASVILETSADRLQEEEIRLIKELGTQVPNGYNVSPGGQLGRLGLPHLPETCAKMSAAWRAYYAIPENFEKLVTARRKAYEDHPDLRSRLSELAKARCADPEVIASFTERAKKQMAYPEARARLSEIATKRMSDPTERKRISEKLTGMKATPQARSKMSESQKRRFAEGAVHPRPMLGKKMSEEAKAAIAAARRRYFENPENRAKQSAAVKAGKAAAKERHDERQDH